MNYDNRLVKASYIQKCFQKTLKYQLQLLGKIKFMSFKIERNT